MLENFLVHYLVVEFDRVAIGQVVIKFSALRLNHIALLRRRSVVKLVGLAMAHVAVNFSFVSPGGILVRCQSLRWTIVSFNFCGIVEVLHHRVEVILALVKLMNGVSEDAPLTFYSVKLCLYCCSFGFELRIVELVCIVALKSLSDHFLDNLIALCLLEQAQLLICTHLLLNELPRAELVLHGRGCKVVATVLRSLPARGRHFHSLGFAKWYLFGLLVAVLVFSFQQRVHREVLHYFDRRL